MNKGANNVRVCGGTFFVLLLKFKKKVVTLEERSKGITDGLAAYNMLDDLIGLVMPKHYTPSSDCSTLTNNASLYKSCKLNESDWLCFESDTYVNDFKHLFMNNYGELLKRTDSFIKKYYSIESLTQYKSIGTLLLEYITLDKTLDANTEFYINGPTSPVLKKDILPTIKVSIQQLILGIWYFIISNRIHNEIGKETFDAWHDEAKTKFEEKPLILPFNGSAFETATILVLNSNDSLFELAEKKTIEKMYIDYDFKDYLNKLKRKYEKIKTLLYEDNLEPFYDFYTENDIAIGPYYSYVQNAPLNSQINIDSFLNSDKMIVLKNATTYDLLSKVSNFIIVSGTGGLGKTMLMRHLLLNSIQTFDTTGMVPIFTSLKDFNTKNYKTLLDFIYTRITQYCDIEYEVFIKLLIIGKAIIIFDALDEINSEYINSFEEQLDELTNKYSSNMYIISSRPYTNFIQLNRFSVTRLMPFSKDQAVELISKLKFREDEPEFKEKFLDLLKSRLFNTHREFAENPLLLTIMLITFEEYADIPSKMHLFYHNAYEALAIKHDASKGGYKRPFLTKLSIDRFGDYLAEFCAKTYVDQKYEFTDAEFRKYFSELKEHQRYEKENVEYRDFLNDLKSNVCLIYTENNKHHFMHRSFQEYFCAVYFAKQKDKHLEKIGNIFEKSSKRYGDKTFEMLYEMIPDKVEEYIYLPYLDKLFKKCYNLKGYEDFTFDNFYNFDHEDDDHIYFSEEYDENEETYFNFLLEIYPTIKYNNGYCDTYESTEAKSFIYKNIVRHLIKYSGPNLDYLDYEEDFVTEYYMEIFDEDSGKSYLVPGEQSGISDEDGNPPDLSEGCGYNLEFDITTLLGKKDYYSSIYDALIDEDCDLMIEYTSLRQYYIKLKKKSENNNDDIFDLF